MSVKIRPETLGVIDDFFRDAPDFFDDVPFIQEKMTEREQQAVQEAVQEAEQRAKRQMLITFLGQKFAFVPDYVVDQIEGTSKSEQLEDWLKQVLFANTLEQMGFGAYSTNGANGANVTNGTNGSH